MIAITANTRQAAVGQKELITTGSAGMQVQFSFSADWDGLSRFAVFRNGEEQSTAVTIALTDSNLTVLPSQNCAAAYVDDPIFVGVYGTDGLGTVIIPTIWVSLGVLREGASYAGVTPAQPTPDMWAQMLEIATTVGQDAEAAAESAQAAAESARDSAITAKNTSEAESLKSEGYAIGKQGGQDVGTSSTYWHNNAKYYKEQAANSAVDAESYATAASGSATDASDYASTAATKAGEAATSANTASGYANTASDYATTASTKAGEASTSATTASGYATTASTKAGEASASATAASGSANSAAAEALKAEGYAVGKQNGTDVSSGSDYYHANAKYYSEQAAGSATTASTKAGEASTSASNASGYVTAAGNKALIAEGWAVGEQNGTPVTSGSDYYENNAKYYAGVAEAVLESIPEDYSELSDDVDSLKSALESEEEKINATLITDSASGAIASFPDGADGIPVKALTVGIEPVQDLHGYSNPWPAGGGANLFDSATAVADSRFYSGGTTSASGTTRSPYIPIKPNTEYYFVNVHGNATMAGVWWFDENKSFISQSAATGSSPISYAATSPANAAYVGINMPSASVNSAAVNYPSTVTTWTPYANICPISGRTGANVTRTGSNIWKQTLPADVSGTYCGWYIPYNDSITVKIIDKGNNADISGVYFGLSMTGINASGLVWWNINNGTINVESRTSSNLHYVTMFPKTQETLTKILNRFDVMVTIDGDGAPYAPYAGTVIPISWQSEAGTVYGGTLTINEDGSEDLAVDYAKIVFDGVTNKVNVASASYIGTNVTRGYKSAFAVGTSAPPVAISDCALYATSAVVSADKQRFNINSNNGETNIWLYNSETGVVSTDTAAQAATKLNDYLAAHNLTIVYKLAAPVTYHLTGVDQIPTLLGTNNIWADCGDITDLEYVADTKLYIQKLTQPTKDDMVANNNIASGKYFMVGNNLYLSTSAIAQGETIVPGTNCTATNLAAALNAINS